MIEIPEAELLRKGKMTKSPFDMTLEEEKEWRIQKMYNNTIPLLKNNFDAVDNLMLTDANPQNDFLTVAEYCKEPKQLILRSQNPNRFRNELRPFIEKYLTDRS